MLLKGTVLAQLKCILTIVVVKWLMVIKDLDDSNSAPV